MKFRSIAEMEFWERAVVQLVGANGWDPSYAAAHADSLVELRRERLTDFSPAVDATNV